MTRKKTNEHGADNRNLLKNKDFLLLNSSDLNLFDCLHSDEFTRKQVHSSSYLMHDINSDCWNTSTFYCSFDQSVGRPSKQQLFLLALMEFPQVPSLIYPQTKISLKHLTHLEVSDISRGQSRNAEKHCCLLQFFTVETTGNKCVSSASNFLRGNFFPLRLGSSPPGCRMDSSTPPGWEHTPRSHTQIHPRLTPVISLLRRRAASVPDIWRLGCVVQDGHMVCLCVNIHVCHWKISRRQSWINRTCKREKPCPITGWHKQNIAMTSAEVTTKFNSLNLIEFQQFFFYM